MKLTVYVGYLGGPVTLTPIADPLAVKVELSQSVLTAKTSRGWDLNTQPSICGVNALNDSVITMFML